MKKIPSVFERDHNQEGATYSQTVTPGCEWVLAGEGIPTRKWDGTAVAIIGGKRYARYDAKRGKPAPPGGIPCQEPDPITGHWPFWVPATRPQDKWIAEATVELGAKDGTYEACGPKIGANGERFTTHELIRHGEEDPLITTDAPRDFEGLKAYLAPRDVEGIVFHHPDGRMAKVTKQGFGLKRRPEP